MNNVTPINVDGLPGLIGRAGQRLHAMREKADKAICLLDARMRTLAVEPEEALPLPNMRWCWLPPPDSPPFWWAS